MKVVIDFAIKAHIIEFEPFLGDDIEIYQKECEKWFYEETKGGLHTKERFLKTGIGLEQIIEWINEVAPQANPIILERNLNPDDLDPSLPALCF